MYSANYGFTCVTLACVVKAQSFFNINICVISIVINITIVVVVVAVNDTVCRHREKKIAIDFNVVWCDLVIFLGRRISVL